jgi:hypothetical protein
MTTMEQAKEHNGSSEMTIGVVEYMLVSCRTLQQSPCSYCPSTVSEPKRAGFKNRWTPDTAQPLEPQDGPPTPASSPLHAPSTTSETPEEVVLDVTKLDSMDGQSCPSSKRQDATKKLRLKVEVCIGSGTESEDE